ncbi:hypothetical protein [Spiroplasma diminutum]|uniref:Lipoprotein n=1 Tax=Spiroplasma diminutum CUAS-1 TaxID=1276221 RepID=S5MER9_9MOLU|nr:hypothetical protein [Spiroplasma diminutum]AGR42253.1 hypothetical protein SDIMI_v3c05490 [Spiroplasma diminutum CUAS-1]
MKKLLYLLAFNLSVYPAIYTVGCGNNPPIPGTDIPKLSEIKLNSYPINIFGDPTSPINFYNFLNKFPGGSSAKDYYNNSFNINKFNQIATFENPENQKGEQPFEYRLFIELSDKVIDGFFEFKLSIFQTKYSSLKFKRMEERDFKIRIIYDVETKTSFDYIRDKKWFAKDIFDPDINLISFAEFKDGFKNYFLKHFQEILIREFQIDFNICETIFEEFVLWDKYGDEYSLSTSDNEKLFLHDLEYFYIKKVLPQMKPETSSESAVLGTVAFKEFPGTPALKNNDISNIKMPKIYMKKENILEAFNNDIDVPPNQVIGILEDQIEKQMYLKDVELGFGNKSGNYSLWWNESKDDIFIYKEQFHELFDQNKMGILQLEVIVSKSFSEPFLEGKLWIEINYY